MRKLPKYPEFAGEGNTRSREWHRAHRLEMSIAARIERARARERARAQAKMDEGTKNFTLELPKVRLPGFTEWMAAARAKRERQEREARRVKA